MTNNKRLSLWALTVCFCATAQAQTPPDAGSLFKQLDRDLPTPPQHAPTAPPSMAPPTPQADPTGSVIQVKRFHFTHNTGLSTAELTALVAPYLNRPLTFSELQNAAADVARFYQQRGWLVYALYPEQDITEGEITMQVRQASFGGLRIDQGATRLSNTRIAKTIEHAITGQAPLLHELDRGLSLANDLPGVSVRSSLEKGQTENTVQTRLQVIDQALVQANVSADNQGSRSTGQYRLLGQISLNGLNSWADRATLTSVTSKGLDYTQLAYSLPIGYRGFRLGLHTSDLQYTLVEDSFSSANAKGDFQSTGLDASYPLVRSTFKNLIAFGTIEKKDFENTSDSAVTSQYNTRVASVGVSGSRMHPIKNNTLREGTLSTSVGMLHAAVPFATQKHFGKTNYSFSEQQQIKPNLSIRGAIQGQHSKDALDSSEKFYLGGPQGVRAYPANEGSASNGRIAKLEIIQHLQRNLTLTGFYDWGKLSPRSSEVFLTQGAYILKGAGLSLQWLTQTGFSLEATWAQRIGHNPNPSSTGSDQDGTKKVDRVWINARLRF